jgi:hypothetical protein
MLLSHILNGRTRGESTSPQADSARWVPLLVVATQQRRGGQRAADLNRGASIRNARSHLWVSMCCHRTYGFNCLICACWITVKRPLTCSYVCAGPPGGRWPLELTALATLTTHLESTLCRTSPLPSPSTDCRPPAALAATNTAPYPGRLAPYPPPLRVLRRCVRVLQQLQAQFLLSQLLLPALRHATALRLHACRLTSSNNRTASSEVVPS